jgi:hypothetical protein
MLNTQRQQPASLKSWPLIPVGWREKGEEEEKGEEGEKGKEEEGPAAHPTPKSLRPYVPIARLARQFAPLDGNTLVDMCSPERIAAARARVCF